MMANKGLLIVGAIAAVAAGLGAYNAISDGAISKELSKLQNQSASAFTLGGGGNPSDYYFPATVDVAVNPNINVAPSYTNTSSNTYTNSTSNPASAIGSGGTGVPSVSTPVIGPATSPSQGSGGGGGGSGGTGVYMPASSSNPSLQQLAANLNAVGIPTAISSTGQPYSPAAGHTSNGFTITGGSGSLANAIKKAPLK